MMFKSEFDQIVRENFDLSDKRTRHYIATLEDAGQTKLMSSLSSALYDKIVNKVDEIDFGSIPQSRGNIEKVQGFDGTVECIDIIRKLLIEYKESTELPDTLSTAIHNIKERKNQFTKAYAMNAEFPMMLYNLVVLSIERSVSFTIATCIQYIKDPGSTSMKMAIDKVAVKKTEEDMLFKQLLVFNKMAADKSLDKLLSNTMTVKEDVSSYDLPLEVDVDGLPNPLAQSLDLGETPFTSDYTPDYVNPDASATDFEDEVIPGTRGEYEDNSFTMDDDEDDFDLSYEDDVEPQNIPQSTPYEPTETPEKAIDELFEAGSILEAEKSNAVQSTISALAKRDPNLIIKGVKQKLDKHPKIKKAVTVAFITGAGAFLLIKIVIPLLKNIVYNLIYSSLKFSDYLEVQAQLIEARTDEIQTSDMDEKKKNRILKKQNKWIQRLRKWSNVFSLDQKQASKKASEESSKDEKEKRKIDDEEDDGLF